jgi:D-glycero-D-manno-heptose 1,7-bisphosphate phosphatase
LAPELRAVFFDRDGVLNEAIVRDAKPYPPQGLEEFVLVPHAETTLQRLRASGFMLIVVTNQPDVARGKQSQAVVDAMHERLREHLPLNDVLVCYHDDPDDCACRKPKPGLLLDAAKRHGIDLGASYLIGDRWRDIEAGVRAGCKTVWIDHLYDEPHPKGYDARVSTLDAAGTWIVRDGDTG